MKERVSKENGAIMLEAMIVVTITLFVLVWLLGIGFVYYQRYTVRIATNDAAEKIAATYYNPTSDIIMGYIEPKDFMVTYNTPGLMSLNQSRAEAYVNYALSRANFVGVVQDIEVTMSIMSDAMGRSHIQLTTTCTFNTPILSAMNLFNTSGRHRYEVTSYAESTNLSDYLTAINLQNMLTNGSLLKGTGFVEKMLSFIDNIIQTYNHFGG